MECRTSQSIVWIRALGIDLFFSGFLQEMGTPIFRLLHNVLKDDVNLDEVAVFEIFSSFKAQIYKHFWTAAPRWL